MFNKRALADFTLNTRGPAEQKIMQRQVIHITENLIENW